MSPDMLKKLEANRKHNRIISKYYYINHENYIKSISHDEKEHSKQMNEALMHLKRGSKIYYCNRHWDLDWYINQNIKDYKKTYLCHDKFCMNCKKLKQAIRIAKFKPILEQHQNLYHMVLTVRNVEGEKLKDTIKTMFASFKQLIQYLNGHHEIKGLDFKSWGYEGALRSLEVTYKANEYHPHLHVIIKLNGLGDLISRKCIQNTFSFDHRTGEMKRLFSDEELMLQKVWKLLNVSERVSGQAVSELDLGYSCILDPICDEDYFEIFKYIAKGDGKEFVIDEEEDKYYMSYYNFKYLWDALFKVRQIQGYGCFYNLQIDDEEEEMLINQMDLDYDMLIEQLKQKEQPVFARQTIQELLDDKTSSVISRKRYLDYLRELYNRE